MTRNRITGDPSTQTQMDGPSLMSEDDRATGVKGSWLSRMARGVIQSQPTEHERARALRRAVRSRDIDLARGLLSGGAGVFEDQEASLGCIASRRQDFHMLDLLIRAGVDINQPDRRSRDHKSRTPLMEAARKGWREGVELLLAARANTEVADEGGATALCLAVRGGKLSVVKRLLRAKAKPNGTGGLDHQQLTPLHEAANEEIVEVLISAGAAPNCRDRQGFTPLHYQSRAGRVRVMNCLITAKADVNAIDNNGRTPLFMVGQRGDSLLAFETLLSAGASLDILDREQNSFIHLICARAEDPRIFERLVSLRKSLFSKQNHVGETPREILSMRGFKDIANSLSMPVVGRPHNNDFVVPARRNLLDPPAKSTGS